MVPLDVVSADPGSIHAVVHGSDSLALRAGDDVVMWSAARSTRTHVASDLVFVGYGVTAPEYDWDDFKHADVRGKVLLILAGDPPPMVSSGPGVGAAGMSYYGRWTYKLEEAARRGASAALIVHSPGITGYPWHTVVASWGRTWRGAPRDRDTAHALDVAGWLGEQTASRVLALAGLDMSALRAAAASPQFAAVRTGLAVDLAFTSVVERRWAANVIGVIPGRDPRLRSQSVVVSAHWDHLGIGPAVNGDSVYHGAEDNASGVADVLAIARAAARRTPPRRTLTFLFTTAEESGLLGATYFVTHPPGHTRIIADLNIDGGNLSGPVRDLVVIAQAQSSLGPALMRFAALRALRVDGDRDLSLGQFFREDHFPFIRAGIPALSVSAGTDFVGHDPGWGLQQARDYALTRYHQPLDAYRTDFDLRGAAQLSRLILDFAFLVADAAGAPAWRGGSPAAIGVPLPIAAP
jgi:Zn-dependent M28 family amino/carboxypeptidase